MKGRRIFERIEPWLATIDRAMSIIPNFFVTAIFGICRYWPGVVGLAIRYVCARRLFAECGTNVRIGPGCTIEQWHHIRCGSNVSFHTNCYVDGRGGITIGSDVSIAHASSVLAFDHSWADDAVPIKYNPLVPKPVLIDDDVWIGCGVRILGGVRLRSRTIVGAGAVLPAGSYGAGIVLGVPAETRPFS